MVGVLIFALLLFSGRVARSSSPGELHTPQQEILRGNWFSLELPPSVSLTLSPLQKEWLVGETPRFELRIKNIARTEINLDLGISLGNGDYPTHIYLLGLDVHGDVKMPRKPVIVGGILKPYRVELQPGEMTTLMLNLADYEVPPSFKRLKMPGSFPMCAVLERGAERICSNHAGVTLKEPKVSEAVELIWKSAPGF